MTTFVCDNGHVHTRKTKKTWIMCPCGRVAGFVNKVPFLAQTFTPYVEEHMTGKPIEITSKTQRDTLCAQHGVTYESNRYFQKPKPRYAVDDLTEDEIAKAIEKSRIPDSTPKKKGPKVKNVDEALSSMVADSTTN